jgi:preprotein translocase subunit SecG
VLIILLQTGKGADIGAVFGGGGSHTLFGSTGASTFLSKVTIGAAVTFMVTSIALGIFAGRTVQVDTSVMSEKTTGSTQQGSQSVPGAPTKEGAGKGKQDTTSAGKPGGGEKGTKPVTNSGGGQPGKPEGTTNSK